MKSFLSSSFAQDGSLQRFCPPISFSPSRTRVFPDAMRNPNLIIANCCAVRMSLSFFTKRFDLSYGFELFRLHPSWVPLDPLFGLCVTGLAAFFFSPPLFFSFSSEPAIQGPSLSAFHQAQKACRKWFKSSRLDSARLYQIRGERP